jgi:hypothetical protein
MMPPPKGAGTVDANRAGEEDCQGVILDHLLYFSPEPYAMLMAYLDESGTHQGSPVMCVAGVLYTRKGVKQVDRAWKKELKLAGLSHFHTVDCAHLRGEFQGKRREWADGLYRKFIEIIKKNACGSMAVYMVPKSEFVYRREEWGCSSYTACSLICMELLLNVAQGRLGHKQVSFYIESGHENMGELNVFIKKRRKVGMAGMGFCQFTDKAALRPLQTADVWAYEYAKRGRDMGGPKGRPARKSVTVHPSRTSGGPARPERCAATVS